MSQARMQKKKTLLPSFRSNRNLVLANSHESLVHLCAGTSLTCLADFFNIPLEPLCCAWRLLDPGMFWVELQDSAPLPKILQCLKFCLEYWAHYKESREIFFQDVQSLSIYYIKNKCKMRHACKLWLNFSLFISFIRSVISTTWSLPGHISQRYWTILL